MEPNVSDERLRRWRLVLGGDEAEGTGQELEPARTGRWTARWPRSTASARGDLGKSAPVVARWLGELRAHFPSGVVRVVQQDAIDRLGLHRLLLEPEVLENVTPDVHLAATLMSLRDALPEASRQVARNIVREVVRDIERRLADRTRAAARGALDRSTRTSPPAPQRDRLGPHDPRQPAPLPARAPDGDPGAADRPRPANDARSPPS